MSGRVSTVVASALPQTFRNPPTTRGYLLLSFKDYSRATDLVPLEGDGQRHRLPFAPAPCLLHLLSRPAGHLHCGSRCRAGAHQPGGTHSALEKPREESTTAIHVLTKSRCSV